MKKITSLLALVLSAMSFANTSSLVCKKIELGDGGDIHNGFWTDYATYCANSAAVGNNIELREITVEVTREYDITSTQKQSPIAIKATKKNAQYICQKLTKGTLSDYSVSNTKDGVDLDGIVTAKIDEVFNSNNNSHKEFSLNILNCHK